MASVASDMGWLWTGWIGPAPVQMSWMLSGRRTVVIVCGLLQGAGFGRFFHWPLISSWTVTLIILGLDSCVLAYCGSTAPLFSLESFYNYARGHCEAGRSFFRAMHSVHLISVEKLCLPPDRELFWGMLGRGDGGRRGIGVSGRGYNEVLALEVRNVVWLRRTKETCKASSLCNSSSRVRCGGVVSGVLACVHIYILYMCVYICVCVYVCGHDICIYMHVCMYLYIYAFIHVCMCMCMHICA